LTVGTPNPYVDFRLGGMPRHFLTPSEDINMLIPNEIIKSVVFIGIKRKSGELYYGGTGFFVVVHHRDANGTAWRFAYLITAKHIADGIEAAGSEFYVRINSRKTGRAEDILVGSRWYRNPRDPDADVAAMPVTVTPEFDALCIPTDMLLRDRRECWSMGIGIGDETFLIGLFAHLKGRGRNTPVARIGNIAMFPDQKIAVADHSGTRTDIEAFLVETRSIGGLSGSPVIARRSINIEGIRHTETGEPMQILVHSAACYLIGVVAAHWDIDPEDIGNSTPRLVNAKKEPGVNFGFAVVVPAGKILDIIEGEELRRMREDEISGSIGNPKDFGATADTSLSDEPEPESFTKEDFEAALRKVSRKKPEQA
jgi:hypothetical protein